MQVWKAFITKARTGRVITDEQISELAQRELNGRQIKNSVCTTHSLARGHQITYEDLVDTTDAMREFVGDFEELQSGK
jgi:hypothetical protein